MSLDINLMGLGETPALAARTSTGGTGPVTLAAAGNSSSNATQIKGKQFIVFVNSGAQLSGVQLPALGGSDFAAEVADVFTIHNGLSAATIIVYAALNATLNVGGSNYSGAAGFTLTPLKTLTSYLVSATQGFGLSA